jgi:puromycin-sensitive aminopeptidase
MLEQYLGGDEFRQGIAAYIKAHSYANTETTDLWDAIEENTGQPARRTMDSWIFQGGYPILTVTDGGAEEFTIAQRRFRYTAAGADSVRWEVPLLVRASIGGEVERQRLLLSDEATTIRFAARPEWIVVNDGGSGFYRVHYPVEWAERLVTTPDVLDALERYNLVSDAWAATLAGAPLTGFAALARHFGNETDPDVWAAVLGPLALVDRFADDDGRTVLRAFVRDLAGPALRRLGWEPEADEEDRTGSLRATLFGALGLLGDDPEVKEQAATLHAAYLEDRSAVPGDLVAPAVAILARNGGEAEYTTFLERMRHPQTPQEEMRYLMALADVPHRSLVQRTLDLALTEIRVQNAPFLLAAGLGNRAGGDLAWDFVAERWYEIRTRFPSKLMPRMLEGITALVNGSVAERVHAFLDEHPIEGGELLIGQSRERLDINVAFRQREEANVAAVFGAA